MNWVTMPETSCSVPLLPRCGDAFGTPTLWPEWAATNSWPSLTNARATQPHGLWQIP